MQLVKSAIAIVAVAFTPSEGAENHADNKALLSQQVAANLLRGGAALVTCSGFTNCTTCCGPTNECCVTGSYCKKGLTKRARKCEWYL